MKQKFSIKNHFFRAFRELFVHHHNSLEFRAKIFALIISAEDEVRDRSYDIIKNIGMTIYKDDEDRANLLVIATKELVKKIKDNNGLDIDTLVSHIQKELREVPRYAKKIELDNLRLLLETTQDKDVLSYQENILEFLQHIKEDTLNKRKDRIEKDEENLESKY